jgi:hypothetical protein
MRSQGSLWVTSAAVGLIALSSVAAQDLQGSLIKPKGDLPLLQAPPGGFTGFAGGAVGKATPDKSYRVLNEKNISTVFGGEKWLEIQGIDDPSKRGWVYTGSKSDPNANVEVVPVDPLAR